MLSKEYEFELKPFDNDVPESWDLVPLEKTGDVVYGIQASVANNLKPVGTKILTNKNITLNGQINLEKINYFELSTDRHVKTILKTGDLLFNWRSGSKEHVGKTAFFDLDGEYTHSSFILRIRTNQRVERWFLYFYLNYLRLSNYFLKLQTYAINAKFNKSALNRLPVILPPLDEQKKIAYVLSMVQRAIAQQKQLIQTTTELKKALMHKLFTEGLHGEKQKETAIGLVPESWGVVEIGSCCELSTGTTPSTKNAGYYVGNNPFIKTNQIVNSKISQAEIFVSDEAVDKYNLKIFPPGTVLVAMYGQGKTRGQVAILDIAASITQNAGAITPHNFIIPEFLYYYLLSQYSRLRSSGMEGHISHLNLGFLGSFKIPLPSSIDEQKKIIQIIASLIKKIEVHASKRDVLQDLFRTLLHQLMTAQIRVHDIDLPGFDDLVNITPQGSTQGAD